MTMKISTSPAAPPATALPPCDNCGQPSRPFCQLFLHVGDNPPTGAVTLRVITQGYRFCGPACRDAWWSTPTMEALIPDPALLASPHPLTALVCHLDPETAHREIMIGDDSGNMLSVLSGEAASYHALDDVRHLERWWRGEAEAREIPLSSIDETPPTEGAP